jgi:hypothetical protein
VSRSHNHGCDNGQTKANKEHKLTIQKKDDEKPIILNMEVKNMKLTLWPAWELGFPAP